MTRPNSQFAGFQPAGLWPAQAGLYLGGRNTPLKEIQVGAFTFDTPSVATIAVEEDAVTVTGLTIDDVVCVSDQTFTTNLLQGSIGRVSAADTLQIRSTNPTAAAIDAASKTFLYIAFKVR